MSNYYKRRMSLAGLDLTQYAVDDLAPIVQETLDAKLHGISFSPYMEGQVIGMQLEAEQIRKRMAPLAQHVEWIRTFSCTEGNELSPGIAAEYGLKSMVGVWIDDDLDHNEEELTNGIAIAQAGHAGILAIGNEVMLRGEIDEDKLIEYIERAKAAVPGVPVGYVDAYFKFEDHPRIVEACDVILVNCYPFWEGYPIEHAHIYMKEMYRRAQAVSNGKKVIIAETGWPNRGTPEGDSVPSYENAVKYFIDAVRWAAREDVDMFYFSSFDEEWKVAKEGDVGAFWGLWDKNGKPKYW
ncbi:glycosyl hydrolase family 17 protein [Maricaulis sp.]|uniref:glycoside hydrolase family 17 protein n=1 Tax=Maricaulis sp. TaxID=1486257 RepID=UPI002624EC8D|nr:glycosyl hydrolase family 17 protein [Maricaulis sp.]